MCQKVFLKGFASGFIVAIPIKYGIPLDPIYYFTLILTTFSNSAASFQRNSSSLYSPNSFINFALFLLIIIGIVLSVKGIFDVYHELQDETQNELIAYGLYGLGLLIGFIIVTGS